MYAFRTQNSYGIKPKKLSLGMRGKIGAEVEENLMYII